MFPVLRASVRVPVPRLFLRVQDREVVEMSEQVTEAIDSQSPKMQEYPMRHASVRVRVTRLFPVEPVRVEKQSPTAKLGIDY